MREEVYVSINEGGKGITYFRRDDGTVPREIKKKLNDLLN